MEVKKDDDGFEYTDNDLTNDKLYTVDALLRKIKYLDDKTVSKEVEENTILRRKVIRISLVELGFNFMTDIRNLQQHQKNKLQLKMNEYSNTPKIDIETMFNTICNEHMFDNPNFDYSKTPIYNA